jgi:hypothetical protein
MPLEIIKPALSLFSLSILLVACSQNPRHDGEGGGGGDPGETGGGGTGGIDGFGGGGVGGDLPACNTSPVQVGGDTFDASEVYLDGTLSEGACWADAFTHWSSPNTHIGEFDCYFDERTAQLRPNDGRLLYTNTFEDTLREFRCDTCDQPTDDPVLPTPPCSQIGGFLVSPTGTTLHFCQGDSGTWYDAGGNAVFKAPLPEIQLRALGYGDLALTAGHVVHLPTMAAAPIVGLPAEATISAVRAREPGSFLLVVGDAYSVASYHELWEVGANGKAVKRGAYPALPAGAQSVYSYTSKIEPCGALLQIGSGTQVFQDIIVRREIGGASAIVYDEANNPAVLIHISGLVTGP